MERQFNISPKLKVDGPNGLNELISKAKGNRREFNLTQEISLGLLKNVEELDPLLPWSNIHLILSGQIIFSGRSSQSAPPNPESAVRKSAAPAIISVMESTGWDLSSPEIVTASAGYIRHAILNEKRKYLSTDPNIAIEMEKWINQIDNAVAQYVVSNLLSSPKLDNLSDSEKALYAEHIYSLIEESRTFTDGMTRKKYFALLKDVLIVDAERTITPVRRLAGKDPSDFQKLVMLLLKDNLN